MCEKLLVGNQHFSSSGFLRLWRGCPAASTLTTRIENPNLLVFDLLPTSSLATALCRTLSGLISQDDRGMSLRVLETSSPMSHSHADRAHQPLAPHPQT
eukprot:CAMPEP_0175890344 /NCGR_PEP_ID=MMETSP0107_2-20121207/47766_1 /TAXON_ID=195067 ORGANISM="Goniomonas pacifica, Strain CCMP1869" /NCGR_SAMPLE_ID=MMETSP0107_2 /ASSEMBLY_ACC=CAM_ASM_000203 /LENGTH=98 /DNA_ID=CAMNT_0017211079 /DNA_START=252 /DNA_END=544 /DNA_ORIENTATION=+